MTHDTDMTDVSASGIAAEASEKAASLARSARTVARDAMDTTKDQLSGAYARAKDTATETGETVSSVVMELLDRRMGDAAGGMRTMSDALHRASDEAGEQKLPRQMADLAADTFDAVAGMIEDKSTREMLDAVAQYGRSNPATFAVGSLIAGFAIGRLLAAEEPTRAGEPPRMGDQPRMGDRSRFADRSSDNQSAQWTPDPVYPRTALED